MQHHLLYDGQTIRWNAQVFRATSGMPGFQSIAEQCNQRDAGPIPSGFYRVFLTDHGQAKANMDTCSLIPAWGIQTIPRGEQAKECEPNWANWGFNRVRLEPANAQTKSHCAPVMRDGFYIHDSSKGFSHGWIEVEGRFFFVLRDFAKSQSRSRLILKVEYKVGQATNGGTKQ